MEALKIRIYQETACYKKPFAFKVAETYPLPPYSTVKGMIHYILKAKKYIPMYISIQGDYENLMVNYQTIRFYKKDGKEIITTKMPLNVHLLYNVNLIIHVYSERIDCLTLLEAFKNHDEYFSLGRREDLARIDDLKIVKIDEIDLDEIVEPKILHNSVYIPKNRIPCELRGINYKLNYKYEIENGLRNWDKVDVLYVEKGEIIDEGMLLIDEEGDLVFFNA